MNRTERLYALVEELRAAAPAPRSAGWLARRYEVSVRTVERDLSALQQAGVPIYAEPGRTGGYVLDRDRTLAPPALSAAEAVALAVGLRTLAGTPFAADARSALAKVLAVMPEADRIAAGAAAGQVGFIVGTAEPPPAQVPLAVREAVARRRVLRLSYADRHGTASERLVEPLAFLGGEHWYLVGWCRLRDAVRGFRLDRIRGAEALPETAPARPIDLTTLADLGWDVDPLDVAVNTDRTVSRTP
jgi:predicted DNA-binding transcriptional regulator YafY